MDQSIYASLSHTHYWYEVGMFKVVDVRAVLKKEPVTLNADVSRMSHCKHESFFHLCPMALIDARGPEYGCHWGHEERRLQPAGT